MNPIIVDIYFIFAAAEHKTETASVTELQATIKSVSSELGDKVTELQRQDKLVRELQIQQVIGNISIILF